MGCLEVLTLSVLGPREKAGAGGEGDHLMDGTRTSESVGMAPEVHLGGGAGSGWLPGVQVRPGIAYPSSLVLGKPNLNLNARENS